MHRFVKYVIPLVLGLGACHADPVGTNVKVTNDIQIELNGPLVQGMVPLGCGQSYKFFVRGNIGTITAGTPNMVQVSTQADPNGTWVTVTANVGASGFVSLKITSADEKNFQILPFIITCGTVLPPPAQCSDNIDNDGDHLIDAADPGCHTDGNANNPASYNPQDNDETDGQSGQAPVLIFSANPPQITLGQSSTLIWGCSGTNPTLTASNSWSGQKTASGNQSVTPTTTGTFVYTLMCSNQFGTDTKNVTVTVTQGSVAQSPVLTFTANPMSILSGQSSTLTWSCTNQDGTQTGLTLVASGAWSGGKPLSGSQVVSPTATSTYVLTCTGSGGSVTQSAVVTVTTVTTNNYVITPGGPFALVCTNGQSSVTTTFHLENNGQTVGNVVWVIAGSSGNSSGGTATWTTAGTNRVDAYVNGVLVASMNVQVTGGCQQPPPATCSITSIDYTPPGGNIAANQNRSLSLVQQANWPSNCQVIWYTVDRSQVRINGADAVYQVGNDWYYAGKHAVATGVEGATPGRNASLCSRVISIGTNGLWTLTDVLSCHPWAITATALANEAPGIEVESFKLEDLKYHDLEWVQQELQTSSTQNK